MLFQKLRWALLGLLALLVVGTAGYTLIEGWSVFDAVWMVVITLTTIGFGEVHPMSGWGRAFTMVYIMLGFSLATYSFAQIANYLAEGGLRHDLIERRRRYRMEHMNDHVIVIGYGRLGREVVDELLHHDVPTCVVDMNERVADLVPSLVPHILGDGTHDETLRRAGIGRARGIAIATPHSASNVYLSLAARQLNPSIAIVTRVDDEDAEEKARRAGANRLVRPFGVGGTRMAQALLHPESSDFVEQVITRHHSELVMQDIKVGKSSTRWHGSLKDLDLRQLSGVLVVGLRRPDGTFVSAPHPDTVVGPGDVLVVVGRPADVARFKVEAE